MYSTMTVSVLLVTLLFCTLTTPISGAALLNLGADSIDSASLATLVGRGKMQAIKDLFRELEEMKQNMAQFINPQNLNGDATVKCGTAGQSCGLNAECCLPMVCHRHVPLNLAQPNGGNVPGQCGLMHHGK